MILQYVPEMGSAYAMLEAPKLINTWLSMKIAGVKGEGEKGPGVFAANMGYITKSLCVINFSGCSDRCLPSPFAEDGYETGV